jgi:RNA polymerase sigma factor (sigma-70 family)
MTTTINAENYLEENAGLIHKLANKFHLETPKFSRDDLVQEGNLAAIRALEKFDPERNKSKISTYVYSAVHRGMRDFVRKNKNDVHYTFYQQLKDYKESQEAPPESNDGPSPVHKFGAKKSPIALRLDVTNSENGDDGEKLAQAIPSGSPPPIDELIRQEQVGILLEEIDALPEREKGIITSRFFDNATLEEIAHKQGCTRQRIAQVSARAMDKLSARVKSRLDGELFV